MLGTLSILALVAAAAPSASAAPAPSAAVTPAAMPSHLVYQFGYNTKAAAQGSGTGTTTIDVGGLAQDGGVTVTATDDWWDSVNPRQTYTCEVYPTGGVACAQPPNALSQIQIAILPMLGRSYFQALAASPTSTWHQSYDVSATFLPSAASGFAGQLYTWSCSDTLVGKGPVPQQSPVLLVHVDGTMKQQGGRGVIVKHKANVAFDPRIATPVYIDEEFTFLPQLTVNRYTIEAKLIAD